MDSNDPICFSDMSQYLAECAEAQFAYDQNAHERMRAQFPESFASSQENSTPNHKGFDDLINILITTALIITSPIWFSALAFAFFWSKEKPVVSENTLPKQEWVLLRETCTGGYNLPRWHHLWILAYCTPRIVVDDMGCMDNVVLHSYPPVQYHPEGAWVDSLTGVWSDVDTLVYGGLDWRCFNVSSFVDVLCWWDSCADLGVVASRGPESPIRILG